MSSTRELSSLAAPTPPTSGPASASPSSSYDPAAHRNINRRRWSNWARTQSCVPGYFHTPRTLADLQSILSSARSRQESVRCVGFGHSPGEIALVSSPDGHMIALGVHYSNLIGVDREKQQVTVESGMSLSCLNSILDSHGLALSSLGSISDQTVGGALACGTHGTNISGPAILAASVVELQLLDASGQLHTCSLQANVDLFQAARISLGALGIVTTVTIQCEPAYDLRETTFTAPFSQVIDPPKFDALVYASGCEFVRLHWLPHTETVVVTRMKKVSGQSKEQRDTERRLAAVKAQPLVAGPYYALKDARDRFLGFHLLQALYYASTFGGLDRVLVPRIAQLYSRLLYPPITTPAATRSSATVGSAPPPSSSTAASAIVRVDRHDRILNFDCLFQQYVTEWAIDQRYTCQALAELRDYIEQSRLSVHFPIEIRFGGERPTAAASSDASSSSSSGGDGIWLSPCYSRAQTWIGIIMYRPYGKDVEYQKYFEGFERIMNGLVGGESTGQGKSTPTASSSPSSSDAPPAAAAVVSYSGTPHWAKNVCMPLAAIPFTERYPRFTDFMRMCERMDPHGMFQNEYVRKLKEATKQGQTAREGVNTGQPTTNEPQRPQQQLPSKL
jgi:L-gulonolactone oxidase